MIHYKTPDEIKTMQQGGAILKVMREVVLQVKPGITTMEIDQLVQKGLKKRGADISFNKVDNYSWATCTSVNAQIVHTPPSILCSEGWRSVNNRCWRIFWWISHRLCNFFYGWR